jgi:hypothetical protein
MLLSMADGSIMPYMLGVAVYDRIMINIIIVLAYGGWHKIFHAMAPPRLKFYSTALSPL